MATTFEVLAEPRRREILGRLRARSAVVACLWDPAAVAACMKAGVGSRITLDVGGKVDGRHGAPLTVTGVVRTLSDGRFIYKGPMMRGLPGRLGPTAVLDVDDVKVILITHRKQALDPEMIRFVGIDPHEEKILVQKGEKVTAGQLIAIVGSVVIVTFAISLPVVIVQSRRYFGMTSLPRATSLMPLS